MLASMRHPGKMRPAHCQVVLAHGKGCPHQKDSIKIRGPYSNPWTDNNFREADVTRMIGSKKQGSLRLHIAESQRFVLRQDPENRNTEKGSSTLLCKEQSVFLLIPCAWKKTRHKRQDGSWIIYKLEHQMLGQPQIRKGYLLEQRKIMGEICPLQLSGWRIQHDILKLLKGFVPKKTQGLVSVILCWKT